MKKLIYIIPILAVVAIGIIKMVFDIEAGVNGERNKKTSMYHCKKVSQYILYKLNRINRTQNLLNLNNRI